MSKNTKFIENERRQIRIKKLKKRQENFKKIINDSTNFDIIHFLETGEFKDK